MIGVLEIDLDDGTNDDVSDEKGYQVFLTLKETYYAEVAYYIKEVAYYIKEIAYYIEEVAYYNEEKHYIYIDFYEK